MDINRYFIYYIKHYYFMEDNMIVTKDFHSLIEMNYYIEENEIKSETNNCE